MNDSSFFSGKVVMRSLPSLSSGNGVNMPTLKRLLLPQGELAQFHDSNTSIHYIAALELMAGGVRGNHYHNAKLEHIYVMNGELEFIAQEMESSKLTRLVMRTGDLVVIQPGVAHAFRILQGGTAIEFAPTRFDPSDVYRHQLF